MQPTKILRVVFRAYFQAFFALIGYVAGANPSLLNETDFVVPNFYWIAVMSAATIFFTFFRKRPWFLSILRLYAKAIGWMAGIYATIIFGAILVIPPSNVLLVLVSFVLFTAIAAALQLADVVAKAIEGLASRLVRTAIGSDRQPARATLSKTKVMAISVSVLLVVLLLWVPVFVPPNEFVLAAMISTLIPLVYLTLFFVVEDHGVDKPGNVDPGYLWREYKILDESVSRRENSVWVTGSIFVTASLLLLGQSTTLTSGQGQDLVSTEKLRAVAVFTSWGVYAIWLFFLQFPAGRLTDWTFKRLRGIEHQLGMEVHRYVVRKRDPIRRWVWLTVLDGLFFAGYFILGLDIVVLRIALPIQVAMIAIYSQIQWCPKCGNRIGWKRPQARCPTCRISTGDFVNLRYTETA